MLSLQWLDDTYILVIRKGCRTLSVFDTKRIASTNLAALPNYIDHALPGSRFLLSSCLDTTHNCFVLATSDGHVCCVDCREGGRYANKWMTVNTTHNPVSSLTIDEAKPNELLVAHKEPCLLNVFDMRTTRTSSITGKKVPGVLASHSFSFPTKGYPLAMHPFFTEVREVVCVKSRTSWLPPCPTAPSRSSTSTRARRGCMRAVFRHSLRIRGTQLCPAQ